MQRKIWMSISLITIMLVTGLLVLSSSSSTPREKKQTTTPAPAPTCCKGTNMTECTDKNKTNSSGEMIMENLSRQFISVTPILY